MRIAPQRYPGPRADAVQAQEPLWPLVERFYARLGTKASAQKLRRDAAIAAQLLADGFSVEEITFAGEWAVQHIPGVTSFGLLPYIMHHALKARHEARQAAAALAEADVGPGHVAYGLMRKLRLNDLIEEAFQRAEAEG